MNNEFKVSGYFYETSGLKFRKFLDIKQKTSGVATPDLMVVMMNPGASYPLDGKDNSRTEVETAPDRTQLQIMSVMRRTGFMYARILNLSDKRDSNSKNFYKFLKSTNSQNFSHSIFLHSRSNDFKELFIDNVPIICAWGVNPYLFNLARAAMMKIQKGHIIGIKKRPFEHAYYHPLPRMQKKKIDWVNKISEQILSK